MQWVGRFYVDGLCLCNEIQQPGITMTLEHWAGISNDWFYLLQLYSGDSLLSSREVTVNVQTDRVTAKAVMPGNEITSQPDELVLRSYHGKVIARRVLSGEVEAGKSTVVEREDILSAK